MDITHNLAAGFADLLIRGARSSHLARAIASVIDGPVEPLGQVNHHGQPPALVMPQARLAIFAAEQIDDAQRERIHEVNVDLQCDWLLADWRHDVIPVFSVITSEGFEADEMSLWLGTLDRDAWLLPPSDDRDCIQLAADGLRHREERPFSSEEALARGIRNAERLFVAVDSGWY